MTEEKKKIREWLIAVVIIIVASIIIFLVVMPTCIVQGTLIATPEGNVPVEDLREGDIVFSQNETGYICESRIVKISSHVAFQTVQLAFKNQSILELTGNHPLFVESSWRPAQDIELEQLLSTVDGTTKLCNKTITWGLKEVYDLSVSPEPNFFANGILVHNKQAPQSINENRAIYGLKSISAAQTDYFYNSNENSYATSLSELADSKIHYPLPEELVGATRSGYTFKMVPATPVDGQVLTWTATAWPLKYKKTGYRSFYVDSSGVVRGSDIGGLPGSPTMPAID